MRVGETHDQCTLPAAKLWPHNNSFIGIIYIWNYVIILIQFRIFNFILNSNFTSEVTASILTVNLCKFHFQSTHTQHDQFAGWHPISNHTLKKMRIMQKCKHSRWPKKLQIFILQIFVTVLTGYKMLLSKVIFVLILLW